MNMEKLENGTLADADEVMDNFNSSITYSQLNNIRQAIDRAYINGKGRDDLFTEAYIDINGQNNTVDATETTATFDIDKYVCNSSKVYYVIIEATSITSTGDFEINGCKMRELSAGKWVLYADTSTYNINKANVVRTMFYDSRLTSTYVTGITALKSGDANDLGKIGYDGVVTARNASNGYNYYVTWNYPDVTTNPEVNAWAWFVSGDSGTGQLVIGGVIQNVGIGGDASSQYTINPASGYMRTNSGIGYGTSSWHLTMMTTGNLTFVNGTSCSNSMVDYNVTHGVPAMTLVTDELDNTDFFNVISHTIPTGAYPVNPDKILGKVLFEEWETGATAQHKIINATEDSGWVNDGELGEFTAFTSEPTAYLIKLSQASTPTDGYPSIKGSSVYISDNYTKIENGELANADDMMNNHSRALSVQILEKVRTTIDRVSIDNAYDINEILTEAYIDSNGRNNSVVGATAIFDTNKFKASTSATEPIIVIEADSLTESSFNINNCSIAEVSAGKWHLISSIGSDETKRAQIYKTLFYGTTGSNPAIATITNCTAIKTNIARDVGKSGYYTATTAGGNGTDTASTATVTATFTDITTDLAMSSWSYCSGFTDGTYNPQCFGRWYAAGVLLNEVNVGGYNNAYTIIDETGVDKVLDEKNNPTTAVTTSAGGQDSGDDEGVGQSKAYFLAAGVVTPSIVQTGNLAHSSAIFTDFSTTYSIPAFTVHSEDSISIISHNIPTGTFNDTPFIMIGKVLVEDWETGNEVYHKVSNATESTDWIADGELIDFTEFTSEATTHVVWIVPKDTTPTAGYPSIRGVGLYME